MVRLLERAEWTKNLSISEWALIKTCNRVEFVLSTEDPEDTSKGISLWTKRNLGEAPFYILEGRRALVHLFRVASGLDSLVTSDGQILGQLRTAGKAARLAGSSKAVLSPLFDAAVSVGMKVGPLVGDGEASVVKNAVTFALGRLGRKPRNVLLIGTGKISKVAALRFKGSRIRIVSRRSELPPSLADFELVGWNGIKDALRRSDLVISATTSRGYVIVKEDIIDSKTRVIMDLGFPRNVDPDLRGKRGVQLYGVDDLAKSTRRRGTAGAAVAEKAVEAEAESFERWLRASKLSPELSSIFRWAEQVRTEETQAILRRLGGLSPREKRLVEAMGRRITSKILAKPAAFAKLSTPDLPQVERMRLLRAVFVGGQA